MVEWWYVVVIGIVVVLIIAVVGVRNRQERERHRPRPDNRADRNYAGEREDTRLGGMSAEDRDWEQASLQRNRDWEHASGERTQEWEQASAERTQARQARQATAGGSPAATPPQRGDRGTSE